jgi:hypothetical protein
MGFIKLGGVRYHLTLREFNYLKCARIRTAISTEHGNINVVKPQLNYFKDCKSMY